MVVVRRALVWLVGPLSLSGLIVAALLGSLPLCLVSLVGLACTARRLAAWRRRTATVRAAAHGASAAPPRRQARTAEDPASLVEQMLAQQRYALLLRPQIAENLTDPEFTQACAVLEQNMALVPAGEVVVGDVDEALQDGKIDADVLRSKLARLVEIEPVFLDRHPVTNAQFFEFVANGGYQELDIWDQEILAAVLDFVDRSGAPGPRFWRDGCFAPGEEHLPVVGVSWYEAGAYARWTGKRLPTDAEWVKAGCWPVSPRPGVWIERRYPWGNLFEPQKANLWASGEGRIVAVDRFAEGVSVGGVYQLIGNVWEWTGDNFGRAEDLSLMLPTPMKSIRGGAFDTYFENQATCHFQSGESPLNRKHNLGFRLALGACDVARRAAPAEASEEACA